MRAELSVDIGGAECRLALPLGGIEDIAKINPAVGEVAQALQLGIWQLAELKAVWTAGLKYGGGSVTFDDAYESLGLKGCGEVARDLLMKAFDDDSPKKNSAKKAEKVSAVS